MAKLFYYQIKGRNNDGYWGWPPIESGLMPAEDSKDARKIIEEIHGISLPGRVSKKDNEKSMLLCTIIPADDKPYLLQRFKIRNCKRCSIEYTLNDKYMIDERGHSDFCTAECAGAYNEEQGLIKSSDVHFDFKGVHDPVIYRILNKTTGMCYIGKTTQAFTLRWYQHVFQSVPGTKFYNAIKDSNIVEWQFEVIERIDMSNASLLSFVEKNRFILERETYWITHYDSINNGYNSAISLKVEEDNLQTEIEF